MNSAGRLDVWSLKDHEHLLAWKPYIGETITRRAPQWLTVLPDNRVLTLNFGGRLICWQLPNCRATYERDLGPQSTLIGLSRFGIFTPPGLSPNRRHLAAWSGSSLLLLDTSSGKRLAVLGGQSRPGLMRPTFSPDGLQLAYTEQNQGAEELVLYDLKKGHELSRIRLPADTWPRIGVSNNYLGGFAWASKRYGVVGRYMVIDLVEERPVWRFNASDKQPGGREPNVSRSGPGFWYYGRTPEQTLNAVEITADQRLKAAMLIFTP